MTEEAIIDTLTISLAASLILVMILTAVIITLNRQLDDIAHSLRVSVRAAKDQSCLRRVTSLEANEDGEVASKTKIYDEESGQLYAVDITQ